VLAFCRRGWLRKAWKKVSDPGTGILHAASSGLESGFEGEEFLLRDSQEA
jgi:hypothetical protein